jgi:hypothetical protein
MSAQCLDGEYTYEGFYVYGLMINDSLVYVGQSASIFSRIGSHIYVGAKHNRPKVTSIRIAPCLSKVEMEALEAFLIWLCQPPWNNVGKTNYPLIPQVKDRAADGAEDRARELAKNWTEFR